MVRSRIRFETSDLSLECEAQLRALVLGSHPAQTSADVTRDIAKRLAQVSLALEKNNYPAQDVATFLKRCLLTMFAEDVGLLPEKSFKGSAGAPIDLRRAA
jgi:hypothetical protein